MSRFLRSLGPLVLVVLVMSARVALGQDQINDFEGGESSGNPLYGYLATAFLGAGIMFVLCKSARR